MKKSFCKARFFFYYFLVLWTAYPIFSKIQIQINVHSVSFNFLARLDYVPGELMLSPSHWRRRLSASASALAQCFGVVSIRVLISTMFKFSKVCVWQAALSSDNSCFYSSDHIFFCQNEIK